MFCLADMVKVHNIQVSEAICKCECGVSVLSPSVSFSWNHPRTFEPLATVFSISPSIVDGLYIYIAYFEALTAPYSNLFEIRI